MNKLPLTKRQQILNKHLGTKLYPKMTLIVGIKYKEGVVLIGDTKITSGSDFQHDNKIIAPLEGIQLAVGSAGFTQLAKEFNPKINSLIDRRLADYRLANMRSLQNTGVSLEEAEDPNNDIDLPYKYDAYNLLDDCALLTKELADSGKVYAQNPLESLVAILMGNTATLYQIDCNGFKAEVPYAMVGSGALYIGDYLKKNYRKDMSLEEAIRLGTFLIKYVEVLDFDKNVGLEQGKVPQIFLINKKQCDNYNLKDETKSNILKDVEERIGSIRKALHLFPEGKLVERPVWGASKPTF